MTLKIRSRSQGPNQFSFINKCNIHADFSSNLLSCSGGIEHNITFWSKFSVFLSAVTLKIRSRSQKPNQGFSMSICCIHANFGQNPVIRSGYIVHILIIHANISADTDADGICITVCASHSNLFVGYMNCHIFFFIFVAQIQGKKIKTYNLRKHKVVIYPISAKKSMKMMFRVRNFQGL